MTETAGALNVLIAQSLFGNVRLTVREHATQGDDLNLILPYASDTIAPTQNRNAILIDYAGVANVKRDIGVGAAVLNTASINAAGWILLRVGDNVTLGGLDASGYPLLTDAQRIDQNTKVVAGAWIDIHGDYDSRSRTAATELDPGFGTVMHLHGTITPGTLSAGCRDEINPGRDCNVTRIFGNIDTDTIDFDQTYLGGRTHVYGSRAMTCTAHSAAACTSVWAPTGDSEDFFFVNQLQTMNVAAGHTLTLDGQDGTDTYVVNTTGSQACLGNDQICGRDLPQLRDQRARHRRAGRRLRRADRQRRRQLRCNGYQADGNDAVPDRRHLPAPPLEAHRLDADVGRRERGRRRPGVRRAPARQLRHGDAGRRADGREPDALLRRRRRLRGRADGSPRRAARRSTPRTSSSAAGSTSATRTRWATRASGPATTRSRAAPPTARTSSSPRRCRPACR